MSVDSRHENWFRPLLFSSDVIFVVKMLIQNNKGCVKQHLNGFKWQIVWQYTILGHPRNAFLWMTWQISWNWRVWNWEYSVWKLMSINRHIVEQQPYCGAPEPCRGLHWATTDISQSQGLDSHAWRESKPRAEGPQQCELILLQQEEQSTQSWQPKVQSRKKLCTGESDASPY